MDALSRHAFDTAIACAKAEAPRVTRYALKVGQFLSATPALGKDTSAR
jgi:hypothetical protein